MTVVWFLVLNFLSSEAPMTDTSLPSFDTAALFSKINGGRTVVEYATDQAIYRQGQASDSVFYLQAGKVKIVVVSEQGKEAVIAPVGFFAARGKLIHPRGQNRANEPA